MTDEAYTDTSDVRLVSCGHVLGNDKCEIYVGVSTTVHRGLPPENYFSNSQEASHSDSMLYSV